MGAPAVASPRVPAPRRAPARRTGRRPRHRTAARPVRRTSPRAPARRANPALAGAALIPSAAVRTAGAVRDLSDSSLIVRLTRGRGWIAVLSTLLGGIVALNVISLSLNAGSGRISQQIAELERSNSALQGELAQRLSASEVEGAAARLGLITPAPEDIRYLSASDSDVDRLARLLRNETVLTDSVPDASSSAATTDYVEPASVAPAPAAAEPAPTEPAPASPAPSPSPGGGTSGGVGL